LKEEGVLRRSWDIRAAGCNRIFMDKLSYLHEGIFFVFKIIE
jgi:hypothetical protein